MSVIRVQDGTILSSSQDDVQTISTDLSNLVINDLADVDTTGVTTNSILKYDGANWVISTDTDTGITAVVEDTTPQLGGDLDLNSNDITGAGGIQISKVPANSAGAITHELTTNMTGISGANQNGIATLEIAKEATNNTRRNWQLFKTTNGASTVYQAAIDARYNSGQKRLRISALPDAGLLGSLTTWMELRQNQDTDGLNDITLYGKINFQPTGGSISYLTLEEDGQINQVVDGATAPNSMNMYAELGATDDIHNFITSVADYGTNAPLDGAQLTHTFKVDGSTGEDAIGRLEYTYDSTETNNKAALRSDNHAGNQQGELYISGIQAGSTLPFVLPSYTVATLPTNVSAGATAYVTDESTVTSGNCLVFYDGTNWKLTHDPDTTAS